LLFHYFSFIFLSLHSLSKPHNGSEASSIDSNNDESSSSPQQRPSSQHETTRLQFQVILPQTSRHSPQLLKESSEVGAVNLRHYLTKLGLPPGLHGAIQSVYGSMESRIWVVDNSLDMLVKDGRVLVADDRLQRITKEVGASRWKEQLQLVDFHMKMAARAVIPTKVSL
jgi:hypothetical protein